MTETKPRAELTRIRPARPEEADAIGELAVRSKGHWGYDAAFLEACREDLALSPQDIATSTVYVLEGRDGLAGYYRLMPLQNGTADLDALFVDPTAIGQGVGRRLWQHAVATARDLEYTALDIQSDPHAEGFYMAMGARRIGESESTVTPGRMLPLLRYELRSRGAEKKTASR
jgi:GNAT superfamily N-acetyltransferase